MGEGPQRRRQHDGAAKCADRGTSLLRSGHHFETPEQIGGHASEQTEHDFVVWNVWIMLGLPQIRFDFRTPPRPDVVRECEGVEIRPDADEQRSHAGAHFLRWPARATARAADSASARLPRSVSRYNRLS